MSETLLVQHRPLTERRMREESDFLAATKLEDGLLVVKDVRFRLVDCGTDLTKFEETFELRRADVAHAQSSHHPIAVELLALLPDLIKRDLVRLKLLAEAHAAERGVDIDERLPLAFHGSHFIYVGLEAFLHVARFNTHLKRVRVPHHHEVGQIFIRQLLGDRHAREGLVEAGHRRTRTGAIEHTHAIVVRYLVDALALLEVLVEARRADADARKISPAQVERVQERLDLRFDAVGQFAQGL